MNYTILVSEKRYYSIDIEADSPEIAQRIAQGTCGSKYAHMDELDEPWLFESVEETQ